MFWTELGGDRHLLSQLASSIALAAESPLLQIVATEPLDDDMFAIEGEVLLRLHRVLERDSAIVRRKKSRILAEKGRLDCEQCRFNFEETYGELGRGFIECHHTLPLSQINHEHVTTLNDLMLVCSNCHRMFHRGRPFVLLTSTRSFRPSANS
jgi:5-methylcytosine-specific restriction protein A